MTDHIIFLVFNVRCQKYRVFFYKNWLFENNFKGKIKMKYKVIHKSSNFIHYETFDTNYTRITALPAKTSIVFQRIISMALLTFVWQKTSTWQGWILSYVKLIRTKPHLPLVLHASAKHPFEIFMNNSSGISWLYLCSHD